MHLGRRAAPKELSERPISLTLHKLADYSEGQHTRISRFNPDTGEKYVADAATGEPRPWPLLGVLIEGDVPQSVTVPHTTINKGRSEGWVELVNERVIHEPGGPADNLWAVTHTFEQADEVIFHLLDGDVRYRVIHNPGRYVDGEGYRIDWFYRLERMNVDG